MKYEAQIAKLVEILRSYRFRYAKEADLQDAVEKALQAEGVRYEREVKLAGAGRIDFMVEGSIGLEIKIKGSPTEVAEQLIRYCKCEAVSVLVLLTGRVLVGNQIPREIHGKEVVVVGLWESMV